MRKFQFQTKEYYHIYNRGVDKRDIFMDKKDYIRFIRSMQEFNNIDVNGGFYKKYLKSKERGSTSKLEVEPQASRYKPQIEFICYCLNPNHYHFVIRQLFNDGITKFMHRLSTAYTMYFNNRHNRSGSLFETRFKAIHIKNYSHFLKLVVYVNCNSEVHQIYSADSWPWSSYFDYRGKRNGTLCNKQIIMEEFKSIAEYKNFCEEVLPDIIKIKQYLLE